MLQCLCRFSCWSVSQGDKPFLVISYWIGICQIMNLTRSRVRSYTCWMVQGLCNEGISASITFHSQSDETIEGTSSTKIYLVSVIGCICIIQWHFNVKCNQYRNTQYHSRQESYILKSDIRGVPKELDQEKRPFTHIQQYIESNMLTIS